MNRLKTNTMHNISSMNTYSEAYNPKRNLSAINYD